MFFLSWAIAGAFVVVLICFRLPAVGALAMPLATIAAALAFRLRGTANGEFITSGWITVHVYSIVGSLALFALAFCCAVLYLVQNRLLKTKRLRGMFRRLPALETVDTLALHLVLLGFPALTLGILTGVVGVQRGFLDSSASPVRLWVAGLTWLIYALYLLSRRPVHWRGKRSNWLLILGTAAVFVATGLHRFL